MNSLFSRTLSFQTLASVLSAASLTPPALAQHDHASHVIEEIIVTTSHNRNPSETAFPVTVLSGERLLQSASATLGDSIKDSLGVHSASFGAGVGQPVIRGLTGNRVAVLQNSLPSLDAAGTSQDHASSVEALLAERIEIVRGPAALLYGNGAIGGVVNVIDGRVPKVVPDATHGAVELRGRTVDSGRTAVMKLDGGHKENIAWHLDGVIRKSSDYDIPGWAIEENRLEALGHHRSEHDDHHEEHAEPLDNRHGYVANSSTNAQGLTAGASWIGRDGFLGFAVSHLENEYGLPLGTHAHHQHDHDDHDHQHHDDHAVRLDLEQSQLDVEAARQLRGFFNQADLQLNWTRYEHQELEEDHVGTRYKSDGINARVTLRHDQSGPWSGVVGFQLGDRDFSASGSEAFIPESDIRSLGVFALESLEAGNFIHEFGLRLNRQTIDSRHCKQQENTWSASAASIWNYQEDAQFSISYSRSERAPTAEELYSNLSENSCAQRTDPHSFVMHGSTARFELGDSRLNSERSNNVELGWRKHLGSVRAEVNIFYNDFDDFIFLSDVGEFDGVIVSQYLQEDAIFKGIEAQVMVPMDFGRHHVDFTLFGDFVRATLDNGDYLPRMPPARGGFELAYSTGMQWSASVRTTAVAKQRRTAAEELSTDSYVRVDAFFDYHIPVAKDRELLLFAKAENLANEDIRDHTSFIKHYAPAAGRSLELGLRYRF